MVICKFYEAGNCRYGQNCRFEHPRTQSNNRFAAFGANSGGGFSRGGNDALPYSLSKDAIEKDLTSEQPQWILSAYGPGRDAPEQLFGGPMREQSFEEMRLHHVLATESGNPQQALNQAQELYQQAQQQMTTAVGNLDGAMQFIIAAEQKHPNRIDICKQNTLPGGTTGEFAVGKRAGTSLGQSNPFSSNSSSATTANPFSTNNQQPSAFGGGAASSGSAFGQPSALGQRPSAFGTPAFGQPSQPTSAFGQPSQPTSAFGQPSQPTSAFGAPAQSSAPAFGQPSQPSSAFGQPSALGSGGSAFGQASSLGQKPNPFGAPAFGQPSRPASTGSAFGQASALGQKPNPFGGAAAGPSPFASAGGSGNTSSPFGQSAQNNASPSPFGQPAQSTAQNSSPFGAPSQPGTGAFGQPTQPATSNAFGQPSQPASSNPFGQPSQSQQATSNPFGAKPDAQPSGFGTASMDAQPAQPAQPAQSAFGQPAQLGQQANPFGQKPSAFGQPAGGLGGAAGANPFGSQPAVPSVPAAQGATAPGSGPYPPGSSKQHPPASSYSSKGMDGRLSMWKGKPVTYQNGTPGVREFNGPWKRIWFPDGPPNYNKDTELPDEAYDDRSKQQWQAFTQTGRFDGGMPELPPKREFCLWDL
ncbi:Nucleoporin AMO1 [Colletotrichum chlorophyti]|uniref:Nucleoporin AMO1 n=1 Tax=Colletotrichum chlorophyti TaxID=708187 RepID=A0A1Q8RXB7_9PEZI|nr:Nucleoporin AMO1 [Colletotrichum chlorophyti]